MTAWQSLQALRPRESRPRRPGPFDFSTEGRRRRPLSGGSNFAIIGVTHALRERNLYIPHDIAVVGFDDFGWADLFQPRLTVMAQPRREIGETAAQMLLDRIRSPDRERQTIRLLTKLVVPASCGGDTD